VALVAVLWVVAALTLMVAGAIYGTRAEIRSVSGQRQIVVGAAQADGALALLLRQWRMPGEPQVQRAVRVPVGFDGVDMEVQAYPMTGFVDLNVAPTALLAAVFEIAGGLDKGRATALAEAVFEARDLPEYKAVGRRFAVVEDLLQVPGVDYDTYQRVADLLTVDGLSSGRVNPLAAPLEVLAVLTGGDGAAAEKFAQAREGAEIDAQTWGMNPDFIDRNSSSRYLFVVSVPLPDGGALRALRWVDLQPSTANGLPWTVFHAREVLAPLRP
jgi:general secretion pathway protein K